VDFGEQPIQFSNWASRSRQRVHAEGAVTNLEIQMDVVYLGDAEVILAVSGAKVGVSNIDLRGRLLVSMNHLMPRPPFAYGLSLYFPNPPTLTMDWRGIATMLEGVSAVPRMAKKVALRQLCNQMVLPNRMAVVLDRSAENTDIFWLKRSHYHGVLTISVIRAEKLPVGDPSWVPGLPGSSDPFVVVKLGAQEYQTGVKKKTLNPEWENESKDFLVDHPNLQVVSFAVYDKDMVTDDFLGEASMAVSDAMNKCIRSDGDIADIWLDLKDDVEVCAELGSRLLVRAMWRPLTRDCDEDLPADFGANSGSATCVLFVGVYNVSGMPEVGDAGRYWLEVSTGKDDVQVTGRVKPELKGVVDAYQSAKAEKIRKLHRAGVARDVIADVLEVTMQSVSDCIDDGDGDPRGFVTATWEQPFTFFLKEPHHTELWVRVMSDVDPLACDDSAVSPKSSSGSPSRRFSGRAAKREFCVGEIGFNVINLLDEDKWRRQWSTTVDVAGCPKASLSTKMSLYKMTEVDRPRWESSWEECDEEG